MPAPADAPHLDRLFFALSDGHRRDMLERLSRGAASASDLAEPLGLGLPSAVKHLALLEDAGFVASRKQGRVRTYTANAEALDAMAAWVAQRQAQLNAQFDRLEAYLAEHKHE